MFPLIYGFFIVSSQILLTLSSPAKYDQRQTGDVNVQIDLKDVKVIALVKSDLLDDYMNYDYVYDYADFTLKPITKPTTKSPPIITNSSSESSTTSVLSSSTQSNLNNSLESSTSSSSIAEEKITTSAILTTDDVTILETSTKLSSNIAENTSIPAVKDELDNLPDKITITSEGPLESTVGIKRPAKRCKGLDKTGRCFRRRISSLPYNLAMKVAPALIRSVRKQIAV
ncbi:uncharacterized protein LOC127276775 [Leptopilina boulardi]|uniref:uncharacterized protein LOC127276775 n=1 Tax=Leptopilina boulardi TaxID=63433 RepID=UPI0021F674FB|nr:uncharacterized protein LOC127276775 [Leptopilina boulardi]